MKLIEDLGMLLPNERVSRKKRYGIYECPVCSIHFKTATADVKNGKSTKCLRCARKVSTNAKHNDSKTRLYNIWCSMIGRVENKNSLDYENYGGRGITICKEWRSDYLSFKKWALENGYISVVPVQFDLTAHHTIQQLNTWNWNELIICSFFLYHVLAHNFCTSFF